MKFPVRILTIMLLIFLASGPGVQAIDLFNTLAGTPSGSASVSSQLKTGLSFRTSASDYLIDTVQIMLRNSAGTPATSGNVTLSLFDATGTSGTPGSAIGSDIGTVPVSSLTNSLQTFTFTNLNRTLSPSTNYWITVSSTDITSGQVFGSVTSSTTGTTTTGSLGYSFYNGSWIGPFGTSWLVGSVSAVAVPEPSTYALAAIATGIKAVIARRRNR